MTPDPEIAAAIRAAIDRLGEGREFLLAYAAQSRRSEAGEGDGESPIRQYLHLMAEALETLSDRIGDGLSGPECVGFDQRVIQDIDTVSAVVAILVSRPSISSEMVNRANDLAAMRSLLGELVFIDRVVLPPRTAPAG